MHLGPIIKAVVNEVEEQSQSALSTISRSKGEMLLPKDK